MATKISFVSGNWVDAGTWEVANSTAELDSEVGSTAMTASYVASSAFTPGAITIDGIAVKIAARMASPTTQTFSVELYNDTLGASVSGTEVTIDVADINAGDTSANGGCGWYVLSFSSVLLLTANNYKVRAKCSTATGSPVTLFRDGTAGNWSRQLRTTTTGAPAAGDKLIVAGENTGAGTSNSYTVTMDETATTDYGIITVNNLGTLQYGTSASTAYYLKTSGLMSVYGGGTLNIGTTGTPMPSTSSAVLEFDSTSAAEFGIRVLGGGTFNAQGNPLTYVKDKLAADAASSATSLTTVNSTAWLSGDQIVLASTTRTASESEVKALTAGASGTTLTISAITNAHSGTNDANGDIRGELGNLTRNVKIRGVSITNSGYMRFFTTGAIDFDYVEIYNMGSSTTDKRGIEIQTTTGSTNIQYSSVYDCTNTSAIAVRIGGASSDNIVFSNNIVWNSQLQALFFNTTTGSSITVSNNLFVLNITASNDLVILQDVGNTFSSNTMVSGKNGGLRIDEINTIGTMSGNVAHANTADGIYTNTRVTGTISSSICYRNAASGLTIYLRPDDLTIDGLTTFGNASRNVYAANPSGYVKFINVVSNAGATLTCPIGFEVVIGANPTFQFYSSTFGATTAHSTADVVVASGAFADIKFNNCSFSSSTELSGQTVMASNSFISSSKHDQTAGSHKAWKRYGTITIDTTIFDVTPSMRLTPNNASFKLESSSFYIAVASGATLTPSIKVRESVVGDGTDYNGNPPRLILKRNDAIGITSDTVIDTATAAAQGAFETLTGTTASATDDGVMEFVIDCDGTTGFVNVDTASVT